VVQKPRLCVGKLQRADEAWIPEDKLKRYALSADHDRGADKARLFEQWLGIGIDDWSYLRDQILYGVRDPVAVEARPTPWGLEYTVLVSVRGLNGANHVVLTAWMVRGQEPPQFTSARVLSARRLERWLRRWEALRSRVYGSNFQARSA